MTYSLSEMVAFGYTKRGVRLWDAQGLLGVVERNDRGERIFTPEHLRRAKIITAAQAAGWPLARIRALLNNPSDQEKYNLGSDLLELTRNVDQVKMMLKPLDTAQQVFDL